MAVKAEIPTTLDEFLIKSQEIVFSETYRALASMAEEAVARIRDRPEEESWYDHSENLRNSIGYIITSNGQPINNGGFKETNAPKGSGSEGQNKGREYAAQIASTYSNAPLLVVIVAGMEYAIYVEAMENKDVLASVELWAKATWREREPKLKAAIDRKLERLAKEMGI